MSARTTVQITMPQMGESVTEGTVLDWLKQVGDAVERDEALLEVSTDKVDTEVPAPAAGTLATIEVEPDQTVPVGAVLGTIDTDGAAPASAGNGGPPGSAQANGGPASAEPEAKAAATAEVVDVEMPQMGESVTEGTVLEWLKQVGDDVERDEGLVEVSTDKVDSEVPAPAAGTISEILITADETAPVGAVLCRIAIRAHEESTAQDSGGPTPASLEPTPGAEPDAPVAPAEPAADGARATPVARRIAAAHGLDLMSVEGSGPRGRVTKEDVLALVQRPATSDGGAASDGGEAVGPLGPESIPLRGPAATAARFMNESRSLSTATSFRTIPVTALDSHRRALKAAGRKLSFTHLIAWAIIQAARELPVMTNSYAEVEGRPTRVAPGGVSLGLAVDLERKDGSRSLVVPVLRDADRLDVAGFVARYDELIAGARDGTLAPEAFQGASITLTNPGGLGTVASVPRLMPGQGAIIATGAIAYPAGMAQIDADRLRELGVSKVMTTTSTYDHRVIQGAESGAFLRRIDELLQGEAGFYERVFEGLGVDLAREAVPTRDGASRTADEPAPATVTPAVGGAPEELLQAVQAATSVRRPSSSRLRPAFIAGRNAPDSIA